MTYTIGPNGVRTAIDSSAVGSLPWGYITGVYVQDNVGASGTSSISASLTFSQVIQDFSVRLWMNGAAVGNDMALGASIPVPPGITLQYSGMWGLSNLTYKDVNTPEFGLAWAGMISGTSNAPQFTHYMVAKNFGFALPTGSLVVGINARVWVFGNLPSPGQRVVLLLDFIDLQLDYTNDRFFQGVQSVTAFGTVTF